MITENSTSRLLFEEWATSAFSDYPGPDPDDDGLPSFERKENGHYKYPGVDSAWCAWEYLYAAIKERDRCIANLRRNQKGVTGQ